MGGVLSPVQVTQLLEGRPEGKVIRRVNPPDELFCYDPAKHFPSVVDSQGRLRQSGQTYYTVVVGESDGGLCVNVPGGHRVFSPWEQVRVPADLSREQAEKFVSAGTLFLSVTRRAMCLHVAGGLWLGGRCLGHGRGVRGLHVDFPFDNPNQQKFFAEYIAGTRWGHDAFVPVPVGLETYDSLPDPPESDKGAAPKPRERPVRVKLLYDWHDHAAGAVIWAPESDGIYLVRRRDAVFVDPPDEVLSDRGRVLMRNAG
jgi:hypothetical protein